MTYQFTEPQLKWINALESGKYNQGRFALKYSNKKETKYCCLGVACEIFKDELNLHEVTASGNSSFNNRAAHLPKEVMEHLNMIGSAGEEKEYDSQESLMYKNDDGGWNFSRIAQFIRENPEKVFKI